MITCCSGLYRRAILIAKSRTPQDARRAPEIGLEYLTEAPRNSEKKQVGFMCARLNSRATYFLHNGELPLYIQGAPFQFRSSLPHRNRSDGISALCPCQPCLLIVSVDRAARW